MAGMVLVTFTKGKIMAKAKQEKQVPDAPQQTAPVVEKRLVLGPRAPKHRVGHNGAAWSAITPLLPATASTLAAVPEVKACGGAKANGLLFVSYAIRRGWLAQEAVVETQQS